MQVSCGYLDTWPIKINTFGTVVLEVNDSVLR